jgi:hypothetical protein
MTVSAVPLWHLQARRDHAKSYILLLGCPRAATTSCEHDKGLDSACGGHSPEQHDAEIEAGILSINA